MQGTKVTWNKKTERKSSKATVLALGLNLKVLLFAGKQTVKNKYNRRRRAVGLNENIITPFDVPK